MAQVGYVRVSSVGQSLDVQMEKLAGCDKVYQEKASASSKRPQLDACLDYIRGGDTLVVTRLDRLARSTLDLCRIAELRQRCQDGVLIKTLMRDYGLSKTSVYRYLASAKGAELQAS